METDRLYLPRHRPFWRSGVENFGFAALIWLFWGLDATASSLSRIVGDAVALMFVADALYSMFSNGLGYPRLTANRTGVQVRGLLGTRGAEWRALSDFEVQSGFKLRLWGKSISAKLLDAGGKPRRFKRFLLQNEFQVPPETLATELNALHGEAVRGEPARLPGSTPSPATG